ncbi:MAG TPA: ABC transporter permease, partial [Candidatus Dormibacteraeota bacterium]|nr:ABC transporter permease [Candidatus Dormibacteraeota bacterium]
LKSEPGLAVSQTTAREALSELAAGRVDLAVIIPQGLGSADADGHLLPAQVAIHYKSGTAAAQGSVDLVAAAIDSADRRTQGAPALFTPSVVTTIPTVTTVGLILPGLLSFNLINSGLMLAAGIFAGYRSAGILRRIEATGTAPSTLVLAHAAANIVLAVSQVLVFSLIADLVFDLRLNLPAMLLSAGLGYMVFLGLGLAISGWVRDAQQAPVIATAIGMPMIFIGLFPPGTVPGLAGQLVSYLPVSLTTDALRHIIDGGDILGVRSDLIALAGWALMVLLVASRSFRWDES